MFNPKEAAEDSHALNLAILFFAACAVLISLIFHHDSGLKYWLLDTFGETAQGTVLQVAEAPADLEDIKALIQKSPRNSLKKFEVWTTGNTIVAEFDTHQSEPQIIVFRTPLKFGSAVAGDTVSVTYLPANPNIAHPTDFLEDFSFDGKVLLWSLVAALVIALLAVRSARKWARFRRQMSRY